jgi:hypothetical protein
VVGPELGRAHCVLRPRHRSHSTATAVV